MDKASSKDALDAADAPSEAGDATHDLAPATDSTTVDGSTTATDAPSNDDTAADSGDAGSDATSAIDATAGSDSTLVDADRGNEDAVGDGHRTSDAADGSTDTTPVGPITGGPCSSGAAGATAFRVRWLDAGGTAYVSYEVKGLPDTSKLKVAAFGYSTGFVPTFVDPYLGDGGLEVDGSCFVDVTFSTTGLASIRHATLSLFGRSYATVSSGSFSWQTFLGSGSTPSNSLSNAAPYAWYSGDVAAVIAPGDSSSLMRIKAGPSSNALVVSQIELCIDAL